MSLHGQLLSRLILLLRVLGPETDVKVPWNALRRNYQKAATNIGSMALDGVI
jgi:hypothetical protein